MNFLISENDTNKLADVADQLKLLSEMAYQTKHEITLDAEGLAVFMRRMADDLGSVSEAAEARHRHDRKHSVTPALLAQIISTIGGLRPILGRDQNHITNLLREFAAADEDMQPASHAWEEIMTAEGGPPITTCEGFYIKYYPVRGEVTGEGTPPDYTTGHTRTTPPQGAAPFAGCKCFAQDETSGAGRP